MLTTEARDAVGWGRLFVALLLIAVAMRFAGCAFQGSLTPVTNATTTHRNEWKPSKVRCLFGDCERQPLPEGEAS